MSLLNLKTKNEPQYKKKIINVVEEKTLSLSSASIQKVKSGSALFIGEMATINGTIKEKMKYVFMGMLKVT